MTKRKVCVVTGSRADYGLLSELINILGNSPHFSTHLLVGAAHYSDYFGLTENELGIPTSMQRIKVNFDVDLINTVNLGVVIGEATEEFSKVLGTINPELTIVLGDRYEVLAAAVGCSALGIPVAHIHGGEVTLGSKDELFRHAITKLSSIHFVANMEFRNRVIQMGENPENVFMVGGLGVDAINRFEMNKKSELEELLGFELNSKMALMTFHPDSNNPNETSSQFNEVAKAISLHPEIHFLITGSNSDLNGVKLVEKAKEISRASENISFVPSLGQKKYFSLLNYCQFVIGNSSSGLLEVPSFKIPTINIGNRQDGRPRARTVIDVDVNSGAISNAINLAMSEAFRESITDNDNPYGAPGATEKIMETLLGIDYKKLLPKKFYDLPL
jgi:GDP/UDP-N,N'-diacetylbacillosamine 2-epimerase (hydrolysing)